MSPVAVYHHGLVHCSACAPADMSTEDVAAEVNKLFPTGIDSQWAVSKDTTFKTGEPNPCMCEKDPTRKHWLLTC